MLYRRLNKTWIDLSILGFGCMRLPIIDHKSEKIDYPKATRLIHYAIDNGVNYIDTAYFYHATVFGQRGESEPFVGEALSGDWRKKFIWQPRCLFFISGKKNRWMHFSPNSWKD